MKLLFKKLLGVLPALLLCIGLASAQIEVDTDGTITIENDLTLDKVLTLTPQSAAPSSPVNGTVYLTTSGELKVYMNGAWGLINIAFPSATPSNLAAAMQDSTSINLTWTDNANNETGYIVSYSADGNEPWTDSPTLAADVEAYTHTGLAAEQTVYYRLKSTGTNGDSPWTATVNATTDVAPASSFAPTDITAVGFWLDANDASTITQSGGKVSQWNDKSGNNLHAVQADTNKQPTYTATDARANNQPSVGSTTNLGEIGLSTPAVNNVNRVYAVAAYDDGTATTFGNWNRLLSGDGTSGKWRIIGRDGQNYWHGGSGKEFTSTAFKNGSSTQTNVALPAPLTVWRFDGAVTTSQSWYIGYGAAMTNESWMGPICEIIMTDGTESAADIQKLEGYLAWKWGLQASLPAGHPYESAAP